MSLSERSNKEKLGAGLPQAIADTWARAVLPTREPGAHKWGVGGLLIVAGSPPFAGAAALCCAAGGRSGAGIVSAALPRSIAPIVVGLVPEATVVILPEGDSASVAQRAAKAIEERLQRSAAMVIGPGLGTDEAASGLLAALFGFASARSGIGFGTSLLAGDGGPSGGPIAECGKPVVVDADALTWLSTQGAWWKRVPNGLLVLTPHPGEMARLLDLESGEVLADPVGVAVRAAKQWQQTVVLKGGRTVVADADGSLAAADTPPSLATAGSGDVLSGSIGALLAQRLSPFDAARLAVFVGGRAAERVARRYGTLGVVAGDLPAAIAEELCALEPGRS
jgi:NAD(P)H-hydrate epimerase